MCKSFVCFCLSVASYFRSKGSNVYCCLVDISKVFDKKDHNALLLDVHDRGMPFYVMQLFSNGWSKLRDYVLWNGFCSEYFPVGSGVQQGSLFEGKFRNLLIDRVYFVCCKSEVLVVKCTVFLVVL
jgi:hypothetical protein